MSDLFICLPKPQFARLLELFGLLLDATETNCESASAGVTMSRDMAGKLLGAIGEVRQELAEIGASAAVGIPYHDDSRGPRLAIH